jgi:uncharacterized membrane protein
MKTILITYLSSLLPMIIIDSVWLGTMAKRFYSIHIGSLMASSLRIIPAVLFYLLYPLGITFFVVMPALEGSHNFLKVFLFGALLGLVAYGTYDLTNQATLREWPSIVTIVDLIWGASLTGTVSVIAVYLSRIFL